MLQSVSKHVTEKQETQERRTAGLPVTELETIHENPDSTVNGATPETEANKDVSVTSPNQVQQTNPPNKSKYDSKQELYSSKSVDNKRQKKHGKGITRKSHSDPGMVNKQNEYVFDNAAFEADIDPCSMRFSDVVSMLIQDQIKEDTHPYGRGNLYKNAMDGHRPTSIYHDDGKLFVWAIVTLFILGIAGTAIFMSIMYTPEHLLNNHPPNTTVQPT